MIAPKAPDAAAKQARDAQEALLEPYAYLTDAQHDLYDRMSEISEEGTCAGWICDNEFNIWAAITLGEPTPTYGVINPRLLRRCQMLSNEIGGWIYWDNGPQFAPMAQWLEMFAQHQAGLPISP